MASNDCLARTDTSPVPSGALDTFCSDLVIAVLLVVLPSVSGLLRPVLIKINRQRQAWTTICLGVPVAARRTIHGGWKPGSDRRRRSCQQGAGGDADGRAVAGAASPARRVDAGRSGPPLRPLRCERTRATSSSAADGLAGARVQPARPHPAAVGRGFGFAGR